MLLKALVGATNLHRFLPMLALSRIPSRGRRLVDQAGILGIGLVNNTDVGVCMI